MRVAKSDSDAGSTRATFGPAVRAAFALALAGLPPVALAQTPRFDAVSPVTGAPDNPGTGLEAGPNGLPVLRKRLSDGQGRDGRPQEATPGLGGDGGGGGILLNPTNQSFRASGLTGQNDRVTVGGERTGGASTAVFNRALSPTLRFRAAPSRRNGSAVKRITRESTQVTTQAVSLTPVVQEAVVGLPLPLSTFGSRIPLLVNNPALGLLTPGFILGTDLSRPIPTDPAYAPIGYKVGTFTVLPTFAQSIGYDSNPDQTTRQFAKGSAALRTEATVDFRSDWSSSSLDGSLRGAYLETPQNDAASRPAADGVVNLRIDANRDLHIDGQARFLVDTQRTTSPNLQAATATSRPLIALYGATLGATQTFNRLSFTLSGLVDRSEFDDVQLSDGTRIRQSDRNLNQFSLRLRTAYEINPDLKPFVDVVGDTRIYDQRFDSFGVQRDSNGVGVLAGATIGLARRLTGEISAGIQHRTYTDPTLRDIDAPLVSATLVWSATPLTTVRFNAATGVTETTIPGSSGVLTEVATLEVQHDLLRNLSIVLGGSLLHNEYRNSTIRDNGFSATARLDYRFNRWLTLRGTYIYQEINSTSTASSFRDNTVLVGIRVNP
ncbi:outer membrane beta-barrel protein [Methylobacterium sp. J-076]|uniref:outer membrane beta-barrel protein n=1 Tax=Methylobacterium sp. J-076 TaxID=2836655 RepID=UPI001FB8C9A3|nr:outer membrane beta-barrel protein [Methylobacterium sp. J-076]MCJ2015678.1 outer membrane beta-barrel protein [Methylobacterium sp. J-076]